MKNLIKPVSLLPTLIGVVVGTLLFMIGKAEEAPGLSLIGLTSAFLLIMWGVYNAGMIKKGFFAPILLFCFGAGWILLSVVLLLDGEFEESPGLALIGVALGAALIVIGTIKLRKAKYRYEGDRL